MTRCNAYILRLLLCAYLDGYDAHYRSGARRQSLQTLRRTGELWDKKVFLENTKAGKLLSDVQEKDLKTRIYRDSAIMTHMDSLKTREGAMVEMIATRVFVKQRGFWKLASVQDTALPAR